MRPDAPPRPPGRRIAAAAILGMIVSAACGARNDGAARSNTKDQSEPGAAPTQQEPLPMSGTPAIKPVRALIEVARMQPGAALPTETHRSLPIPTRGQDRLNVTFLFVPSRAEAFRGLRLFAPSHLGVIDARDARFELLRTVRIEEVGLRAAPADGLGVFAIPEGVTKEEFTARRERLLDAYDRVLPMFASRASGDAPAVREAAGEFRRLFGDTSEAALRPCYAAVGAEFFAWLDRTAEGR